MPGPPEKVFTVSQLTERVKATLEDGFPWVTVEGEISNFRPSSTGHYYFSLKDSDAMLSVVMFRNRLAGAAVRACGRPARAGIRQRLGLREAGQLPARLREPAPGRRGRHPRHARGAQTKARRRGAVRGEQEETAAPVPVAGRGGHLPHGSRDPGHPARPAPAQRGHRRRGPARPCPGRWSRRAHRLPDRDGQPLLPRRRAHRGPGRGLAGGPPALLLRARRSRHRRLAHPRHLGGRARDRRLAARISRPMCAPPLRRPRPRSSLHRGSTSPRG